jgi:hypothetical protein
MKKIIILLFIPILLFVSGCNKSNNQEKKEEKEKKSDIEIIEESLKDYNVFNNKIIINNTDQFKYIYYVTSGGGGRKIFITLDGSIIEFSDKKFSSTDSYIRNFNSKLPTSVIMGFANFSSSSNNDNEKEGEYWFLLNDYSIVKFDSNTDTLVTESNFINDGWGRESSAKHIIEYLKTIVNIKDKKSWVSNLREFITIDNEKMYIYDANGPSGDEEIKISNERELPKGDSYYLFSNDFIKVDNDYYIYKQTNVEETEEYVDIDPKYDFVKILTKDIQDNIVFWDGNILIFKNGKVYNTARFN